MAVFVNHSVYKGYYATKNNHGLCHLVIVNKKRKGNTVHYYVFHARLHLPLRGNLANLQLLRMHSDDKKANH